MVFYHQIIGESGKMRQNLFKYVLHQNPIHRQFTSLVQDTLTKMILVWRINPKGLMAKRKHCFFKETWSYRFLSTRAMKKSKKCLERLRAKTNVSWNWAEVQLWAAAQLLVRKKPYTPKKCTKTNCVFVEEAQSLLQLCSKRVLNGHKFLLHIPHVSQLKTWQDQRKRSNEPQTTVDFFLDFCLAKENMSRLNC